MAKKFPWIPVVLIVLVGLFLYYNPQYLNMGATNPIVQPTQCPIGSHLSNGVCVQDVAPSQIYNGPVSFNVTSRDGDTKASLALTNAVFWIMHVDGAYAGTATQATASTIPELAADSGQMILVVRYLTSVVGFVDPDKTVKQNKDFMKAPMYLKDVDTNGQLDQCYPLDLSQLKLVAGQTIPVVIINLIAWGTDTTVVITNISSPINMNVAGDYHATGYIAGITETQQWQVQRITLACNATAGSFGTLFAAGSSSVKAFKLQGLGAQTSTVYGRQWVPSDFVNPNYDSAQYLWDIYKAHSPSGAVDIAQVNYGMPFVNERQSGTTWLQFDVWIHTTGDMVATNWYYLNITITCTDPAGLLATAQLGQTYTG